MNILASYSWLKTYCSTDASYEVFARELSLRSMSVEHIDVLADRLAHVVVGEVKHIEAHPQANKLRIAHVDVGDCVLPLVCGGTNLALGQRVVVARVGAQVRWHGEGDLITLQEAEIRGVKSAGMICAPSEIGFEKIAVGEREIWDITALTTAPAGTALVDALDLNDVVFDIEITTNRPDCMGIVGLAREGAASVGAPFVPHECFLASKISEIIGNAPAVVDVTLAEPKLCTRYMVARVDGVRNGPSPWWLQKFLLLSGHRPVNLLVDITNLVLQEFGQPLHVFDAAIAGNALTVRKARKGEQFAALDGKTYSLPSSALVIANEKEPLALAGIMGGATSGATDATTSVLFEAATFYGVSVRKTSRALNLYSDAQLLFEKQLSPEALPAALAYAVSLAQRLGGGTLVGVTDVYPKPEKPRTFVVRPQKIEARMGVSLSSERIAHILTSLGFLLEQKGKNFLVTVPFWRAHDIEHEIDFTEEIARMYGYHVLPSILPATARPADTVDDAALLYEMRLKHLLAAEGFTEFFDYSFVDGADLTRVEISPSSALAVANPLSADLAYLRPSLLPGFLRDCAKNEPHTSSASVFALSRVYLPQEGALPDERYALACGIYGVTDVEHAYRQVRGALERVFDFLGLSYRLEREDTSLQFHPGRTARIVARLRNEEIAVGSLGQIAPSLQDAFGLMRPVVMLTLDLEALIPCARTKKKYTPVSPYQHALRSVSLLVDETCAYADMAAVFSAAPFVVSVSLQDIYRNAELSAEKKSVTFTVTLVAPDHTLTTAEIDETLRGITEVLRVRFGAQVR